MILVVHDSVHFLVFSILNMISLNFHCKLKLIYNYHCVVKNIAFNMRAQNMHLDHYDCAVSLCLMF